MGAHPYRDRVLGAFDLATAVTRRLDGVYEAAVLPGWDISGNANGGYLLAIAGRAMADAVGRPPLSVTAHFLSRGTVGPCTVEVVVVRVGRRTATASAAVKSNAETVITVIGTFADQVVAGPAVVNAKPPELPPIEQCIRASPPKVADEIGFGDQVDVRIRPEDASFRTGAPTGTAAVAGWFAFADGHPVDLVGLLQVSDAFVPVIFQRPEFPIAWAPTLELTVHIRGVPASGPLRCVFTSRFMQAGMFEEDGEMWDSDGVLVAQSRQLALIPRG